MDDFECDVLGELVALRMRRWPLEYPPGHAEHLDRRPTIKRCREELEAVRLKVCGCAAGSPQGGG